MKKILTITGLLLSYFIAWIGRVKYVLIAAIVLATVLASCSVNKYGCPPSKIEKLKFNK